jgi:hypothetical protein
MAALSAPQPLWLAGEGETLPPVVAAAYRAADAPLAVTLFSGEAARREASALEWLLHQ